MAPRAAPPIRRGDAEDRTAPARPLFLKETVVPLPSSTLRTVGESLLDSVNTVGGVAAGTVVGRWAHARTSDRGGSTSRLATAVAAGLAAALVTDAILDAALGPCAASSARAPTAAARVNCAPTSHARPARTPHRRPPTAGRSAPSGRTTRSAAPSCGVATRTAPPPTTWPPASTCATSPTTRTSARTGRLAGSSSTRWKPARAPSSWPARRSSRSPLPRARAGAGAR